MMTDTVEMAPTDSRWIRVFSSPSDAPRVRWRTDLISAGFIAAMLVALVIVAGNGSTFDDNTLRFAGDLPGWLLWLGQVTYLTGELYTLALLIGVGLFARGRLELLRDMLLAALLALVVAVVLTRFLDERWPEFAFLELDRTATTFPAFFLTSSAAVQAAASPHLSAPMRKIGWTLISAAAFAALIGAVQPVSDVLGALLVGLFAAAIIRFVLGTSAGLPSIASVRQGLADLNVAVSDLRYADKQPTNAIVLVGTSVTGDPLMVTELSRDAWSSRRWTQWWRSAWYQDLGSQFGSDRRQQVEHEALALFIAREGGVSVPDVVGVGTTDYDDAVLVTQRFTDTVAGLQVDAVDDDLIDAIWIQLTRLHDAGLAHGSLDASKIWLDATGVPALAGFGDSAIHASPEQMHQDVAALLAATTLIVGADRAIAASRRALSDEALTAALPMLQDASLSPTLRHAVKEHGVKIGDLRKQVAVDLDTKLPEIEQLQRVTLKSVLMVVFVGFAAYGIVGSLADVGFDNLTAALGDARWGLIVLALVSAQATNYTDALSLAAVSPKPVPVGVATVEQFALSFVNIAVPSAAGRVSTNARFFQKFGIAAVTATAVGAITGFIGFIAQVIAVGLTVLAGKGSVDFSEMQGGGGALRLVVMAIVICVVAILVVLAVPRWRHWVNNKMRKPLSQLGEAFKTVKNPRNAGRALGASIGTEVLYGAGLALCVLAVGGSVSFGEAIFINVTVSLFAGLMPIPGGVGVTEAGLAAGLTAVGVPADTAMAAVLVWRLASYYLPPVWGWFCLRWLTRHDYL
jgi:uncharacterized protein (TIRG00374 family)